MGFFFVMLLLLALLVTSLLVAFTARGAWAFSLPGLLLLIILVWILLAAP